MSERIFRFSIDRGGTFTDIYAEIPTAPFYRVLKLLSVDPSNYDDAPREGIRRILQESLGIEIPRHTKVPTKNIEWIRMGTTVATNALLERKGERTLLLTTKGFRDLLKIGNQTRPHIFDLEISKPELLYERVLEVNERVRLVPAHVPGTGHSAQDGSHQAVHPHSSVEKAQEPSGEAQRGRIVTGVTGELAEVLEAPNLDLLREQLTAVRKETGIESVAIVFLHSFNFPLHEQQVGELCYEVGFTQVSMSHALSHTIKAVPRGHTATVDAYLTPLIKKYISGFTAGFDDGIGDVEVSFMMSDGGLCPMSMFNGFRSILSGPAGGVVGYSSFFENNGKCPMIGIDMGGTSTDVSRYAGELEHVFETETAGVFIQAPQLAIETVAAGGGSRIFFRSGLFVVGPESSSAHPGPVCYRKNGFLAITDCNLVLGRVLPEYFPKIFGKNENEPLATDLAFNALQTLTDEINDYYSTQSSDATNAKPAKLSVDEVAFGFVRVANEAMCRPIRNITEAKGYEPASHVLSVFGGAGPQHACSIARSLGMKQIFVPRFASILSAYGIGLAHVVFEDQIPCHDTFSSDVLPEIHARLQELEKKVLAKFGTRDNLKVEVKHYLNLRYEGTDTAMMIERTGAGDYVAQFEENYKREYGFLLSKRPLKIDNIRVRATYQSPTLQSVSIEKWDGNLPKPIAVNPIFFEGGRRQTPIFSIKDLLAGSLIHGPAVILDNTTSIIVEPNCTATITDNGDVRIDVEIPSGPSSSTPSNSSISPISPISSPFESTSDFPLDSIQLSVFAHRFMSIAEQMGRALERTAVSTNIKERRDFSCALFGPNGALVANAPHLPVHLGSMQEAVKWQLNHWGDNWHEGEVIATNHPDAGGSHLPDITVITPVFVPSSKRAVFYVASRGHHADIGGIQPGSMPPFSTSLTEEGASFKYFKLVENGEFQEQGITDVLMQPAFEARAEWQQKCSGTRNLADNLSDLKAQIAANNKGIRLVNELIASFSLPMVHSYMLYIQQTAEQSVRKMLRDLSLTHGLQEVDTIHAVDYMDNGAQLKLALTIDRTNGTAKFDFSGTDPQIFGNINAPRSVTMSAIIYSLRCLVKDDIPLNSGCMDPIEVIIPRGSFLDPLEGAAVVGGNVLTSQRVTDVVLMAFQAAANSQGCMNNFTFGNERMGYYETIAGGAGAGPTWQGQDSVQVHMTNTRITDAEILERRYPVLLREFSVREGSGGVGQFRGGHGVVREFEFLAPLDVGILSERRSFAPNGLHGGGPGLRGRNIWFKRLADGSYAPVFLGGKNTVRVQPGDRIRIESPGGGGYGSSVTATHSNP
jgi:5-oxoprolinase (ATP-hydrolysing)